MSTKKTQLQRALEYARRGWAVLPIFGFNSKGHCACSKGSACTRPGKHPRTPNGVNDATTDVAKQIRQWWDKWPHANIGIATGKKSKIIGFEGLGRKGYETFKELQAELAWPNTTAYRGGGVYLIYRHPGFKVGNRLLGPGLRVKSDGAFMVAPRSRHLSDKHHEWLQGKSPDDLDPAELPEPWLQRLRGEVQPESAEGTAEGDEDVAGKGQEANTTAEIRRLAELADIDYDRERDEAAKRLKCRKRVLDKLVQQARDKSKADATNGGLPSLREPELWPDLVDGAALLEQLTNAVLRYVVVAKNVARAIALWIVHTHALEAFNITPRLAIKSPVKNCGKSTLLDVLSCLVPRPLATANITAAAVFRIVEAARPTLLIDEGETFLLKNEELRGILNSGHRRSSARVMRVGGDNLEPREFGTFAAAAIACIGSLPDTLEDRSIRVNLKRRRPEVKIDSLDLSKVDHLTELARKTARWASDHLAELKKADPKVPATLVNREADNWRPLFAIADAAGGKWPNGTRGIAEAMTASARNDEKSIKIILLRDIQVAFAEHKVDRLSSARLVSILTKKEGHLWREWKGNQPLTPNALARLLDGFNIHPGEVRIKDQVLRGYKIEQFADAFSRYVPVGDGEDSH